MSDLESPAEHAASTPSTGLATATPPTPASLKTPVPPLPIQQVGYASVGRRPHKKSRTGCATCKARKIKCDERHPACLNCISHGVECPFLKAGGGPAALGVHSSRPRARTQSHSPASPATPASASSPHNYANLTPNPSAALLPDSGSSRDLPLLELELLHNFTTKTHTTLTADASVWPFWRDDVVQVGFTCDYVMRAVLAVSALHLASERPDRRDFYIEEGILLHQRAARSAMRVMAAGDKIDVHQGASLFLFSMLTMFFALASPRRSNPDGTFFIGDSGFPGWAFLLAGTRPIIDLLGERGKETVAGPFLRYGARRWHAQRAVLHDERCGRTSASASNPENGGLLAPLRARINAAVADPELLQTYAHALDELELAFAASGDPDAPRDVLDAMVWLWVVSDSLVPLLRVPSQEAVAIFAYFCVLLKKHESHWWLRGWGDHAMARAHEILDEEHRGWIEWPIREMGWMGGGTGGQ
ncbi:hypothetical protein C8A05DRAFT_42719 [Staphylotrichum tortipilum]|uniref:Zn(2)-C6 fungal-type domain-containing protein n=1 Tax=Staphylotrichum tortipilum TaxID=2831512 RepID=A0AAN6RVN4_9PEZI|nr:hypothetical protein C8A05DRAFT_42719 [Staphylotrichum longicolle]